MSTPISGWYPDKEMHNTLRLWDGEKWTDQTMPGGGSRTTTRGESPGGWLFLSFAIGIVGGAVSGSVLKESVAMSILILSVTAFFANAALFVAVIAKGVEVGMAAHERGR